MNRSCSFGLLKCCFGNLHSWTPIVALQRAEFRYMKQIAYGLHLQSRCTIFPQHAHFTRRCYSKDSHAIWQSETLQDYLNSLCKEHERLSEMLNHTSVREEDRRSLGKRHSELSPVTALLHDIQAAELEARELESMCADIDSKEKEELLELAIEEKYTMNQKIDILCRKLLEILVPNEKYDMSDAVLEVTSGRTTGGGLHHAAARISGQGVYKLLKYEGGTHRVQRIPEVGLSSRMQRIHTGTMTVIVLPQPAEVDIKINPKDLRIDTFRAKGAGGQHVNTTDSAVRVVHIPTGIAVECQQERSQISNKDKAMKMLKAKLHQQTVENELSQRQSARKLQVGTRAQSDRIRTYNFTQDRVTDHRISYEVRNIKEFLSGESLLHDLIYKLQESADIEALLEVIEKDSSKFNR
ncbi:peptide chain release factor 1, mitochondrial isoform X2 [Pelobates fuscus]|uniref:peptide chain release factor 1, mitochondrial isoform X2 n=1 Tax=Pelobates fuscus TaxID=191477 RepID=UPI002FE47EDB